MLLDATLELAGEVGIHGMSMDDLAHRGGRVQGDDLSALAVEGSAGARAVHPGHAAVRSDRHRIGSVATSTDYLGELGRRGCGPGKASDVLPDLIVASVRDEPAESLDAWIRHRRQPLTDDPRPGRWTAGSSQQGTDIDTIIDALIGAFTYRRLLSHEPLDDGFVARLLSTVLPSI